MKRLAFSDPMMRAIAAGQKTMTRRPIKNINVVHHADGSTTEKQDDPPRFTVGDLVAATCAFDSILSPGVPVHPGLSQFYRFTRPIPDFGHRRGGSYRTSRVMPAALAPFVLRITEVRAERLGEIKPSDALREGMFFLQPGQAATDTFRAIWEGLYGDGSFERDHDSWVWVYGFEIAERRI